MTSESAAQCTACKAPLDAKNTGPCPSCGAVGTKLVALTLATTVKVTPTIDIAKLSHSLSFNRIAIVVLIGITLISPLVGFVLPGIIGIAVSYGLGILGLVIGYFAITKVKQIERYLRK
jgi:hypothetical protein